ncbi:flavin-binding monooxygenase-like family protein [Ophiobolus disseminans]|uniref:Flavin-binding monooxygenase-like family protein n=1 Tax=Ophiobolus disseminans TaxID=1469910 RepID=A0A6A7A3T5_9PLEO|nr:flavin-binding monooxygenase-like family protein [Ophiobolus disseminans]
MTIPVNPIPSALGYEDADAGPGVDALNLQKHYGEERAKRLRDDGNDQYHDISLSPKFNFFIKDPWADASAVKDAKTLFPNNRCHMLILGAGWGGLLYAIRMIQAGVAAEDISIVDTAAGFGGTWYWNRYPGVACDIESFCYLPLLEETGYVPKQRYASGEEIRGYAEAVAEKWGLKERAVWLTKAERMVWDEEGKEWEVELVQKKDGVEEKVNVRAGFVACVNGVLNWPKLPGIPEILDFEGDVFHSSRWDYDVTGGSPEDPSLKKLEGKNVAIIGTGATAIQIIPHLARWAKHIYVVQRTPASVDERHQRDTDPKWFQREVATSPGWQRERLRNFHQHLTTEKQPEINLVNDEWTSAVGMVAIAGNPSGPKTMDALPAYMEKLHALDAPRQSRIRTRVSHEVHDPDTAENLKAWYPTWCKRPTFSSTYLASFNRPNTTLLSTPTSPLSLSPSSITVDGTSYPIDTLICATGFRAPFTGSPAQKANMSIVGRGGVDMATAWGAKGPSTLHGVMDTNYPNLFLSGPWQASLSPNNLFNVDVLAQHAAAIYTYAKQRAGPGKKFSISVSQEAVSDWGQQVLMRSPPMAAIVGCTPSYFNVEGALDKAPPEVQGVMARSGLWGKGIEDFVGVLEGWRGGMEGVEVGVGV